MPVRTITISGPMDTPSHRSLWLPEAKREAFGERKDGLLPISFFGFDCTKRVPRSRQNPSAYALDVFHLPDLNHRNPNTPLKRPSAAIAHQAPTTSVLTMFRSQ